MAWQTTFSAACSPVPYLLAGKPALAAEGFFSEFSAILPVGLALFYQRTQPFLRIF
jgi:hypothetical protein